MWAPNVRVAEVTYKKTVKVPECNDEIEHGRHDLVQGLRHISEILTTMLVAYENEDMKTLGLHHHCWHGPCAWVSQVVVRMTV